MADDTFERYLRNQGIDPAMAKRLATPPIGEIFKPKSSGAKQGEFKYALAVRDGTGLLVTMTVRRDPKGDVYVIYPRPENNPHASYHHDGTFHHKSGDFAMMSEKRQPSG